MMIPGTHRALRLIPLLFAATLVSAAGPATVTILEVTGKWIRVADPSNPLAPLQAISVGEGIRFIPPADHFAPGTIVFANSSGARYDSIPCNAHDSCPGIFNVRPPAATAPPPGALPRVFKVVTDFFNKERQNYSNAIGHLQAPSMGGSLRDAVSVVTKGSATGGDALNLCETFAVMPQGTYAVVLTSDSGRIMQASLNWSNCPAYVPASGLTPGIYELTANNQAQSKDVAWVLVSPPETYDSNKDNYAAVLRDTDSWFVTDSNGVRVQTPARRLFLVAYLRWLASQPPPAPAGVH